MAEFQWWLLLVGLVAGGGLVAVVTMDGRRREEDVVGLERRAEATWIAERVMNADATVDVRTVEDVLRLHREYLGLPPPDELLVEGGETAVEPADETDLDPDGLDADGFDADELDGDSDEVADDVRDDRRGTADEDLTPA